MNPEYITIQQIVAIVSIGGISLISVILIGLISLLVGRLSKSIREHLSVAPDVTDREVAAEVDMSEDYPRYADDGRMKRMFERIDKDKVMEETREQLSDSPINYVQVLITTETGCDPEKGEYGLEISSFIGCLDISSHGGVDDVSLVKECIENDIDFSTLPEEGTTEVILKESGEWEDVFWNKYYIVDRVVKLEA